MNIEKQRQADACLESMIEQQYMKLIEATSGQSRRDAWYSMKSLIEARSPFQVRRMERERGLTR